MLATHAMIQALYISTGSTNQLSHYGLGLNLYTHFTSPIRRYADLLVKGRVYGNIGLFIIIGSQAVTVCS